MEPVTISAAIAAAAAEVMAVIAQIGEALSLISKAPDANQVMSSQRNSKAK